MKYVGGKIDQADIRALLGQRTSRRRTNPAGCPGNNCRFIHEIHGSFLLGLELNKRTPGPILSVLYRGSRAVSAPGDMALFFSGSGLTGVLVAPVDAPADTERLVR